MPFIQRSTACRQFRRQQLRPIYLLVTMLLCLLGCGEPTVPVSGEVTYDGKIVETGQISFIPVDQVAAPDAAVIENGRYSLKVSPGEKRVEIRASRPLPPARQNNPEMGLLYEDFIPKIYNDESTLTASVQQQGAQEFNFPLTVP